MAILLYGALKAQEPCTINCDAQLPVCSESSVTLSVEQNALYTYHWSPGGQTTYRIIVKPKQTTTYSVVIRDAATDTIVCQPDPFTVEVKPRFQVHFKQVLKTCSNHDEDNGKTAQVLAYADGSQAPYTYDWQMSPLHIAPGCDSLAIGLEAYKYYRIKVTDGRGCSQYDSTTLRAYTNPVVEINTNTGDTVYLQNPHVTYSFVNKSADSIAISNFYWILNSQYGLTSNNDEPRFTYVTAGDFTTELKVYNPQGCDTSYYKTIKVNPVKLKIPNVFTPNGDGINDYFIISIDEANGNISSKDGSESSTEHEYDTYEPLNRYYEKTELVIFNRWGRIVYQSNDYHNDWDGDNLPDATYFYVLKCHGLKQDANYQGSVMIFRGSN